MAKKYYEGTQSIKVFITYGVHADSKEEAYDLISRYITEYGIDLDAADWDTYDSCPDYVDEMNRPSDPFVVNIDEEEEL